MKLLHRTTKAVSRQLSSKASIGLYGVKELGIGSQQDFDGLLRKAIQDTENGKRKIEVAVSASGKTNKHTPKLVIHELDKISHSLCLVMDSCEVCRSTHHDPEVQERADVTYGKIIEFTHSINMDVHIYNMLVHAINLPEAKNLLTQEESLVGNSLKADFEREGVHLSKEKQDKAKQMLKRVMILEDSFLDAQPTGSDNFTFTLVNDDDSSSLFDTLQRALPSTALKKTGSNVSISGATNASLAHDIIISTSKEEYLREAAFRYRYKGLEEKLSILNELIAKRHDMAQLLGFQSHTHLAGQQNTFTDPILVEKFLLQLADRLTPYVEQEVKMLLMLKQSFDPLTKTVNVWDVPFLTRQYHELKSNSMQTRGLLDQFQNYLSFDSILEGLGTLVRELFGIDVIIGRNLDKGENWTANNIINMASLSRVYKLEFFERGHLRGVLYVDPYRRNHKFSDTSHFQIECAYRGLRIPRSLIVMDIPSPETPLRHGHLVNIFHEFGHALSNLLSATELQHLSGTRGKLDFVEVPSTLMEYFAHDPRVLKRILRHRATKQPPPDELLNLIKYRKTFAALELQEQVIHALYSSQVFLTRNPDTSELMSSIRKRCLPMIGLPSYPVHWAGNFSHLIGYSSGYASYVWARVFASDIWHEIFNENPLSRQGGQKLRSELLQYGGARDGKEILRNLLNGRDPRVDSIITEIETVSLK